MSVGGFSNKYRALLEREKGRYKYLGVYDTPLSFDKIEGWKNNPKKIEALDAICKNTKSTTSYEARRKFIKYLADQIDQLEKSDPFPPKYNDKGQNLKEFLPGNGMKLLEDALQEEESSIEYRKAAFINSLNFEYTDLDYSATTAGPASIGKTSSSKSVMEKLAKGKNKKPAIDVDGDAIRQTSQIRSLLARYLMDNGASNVKGFHKYTQVSRNKKGKLYSILPEKFKKEKVSTKKYFENAARILGFNIQNPNTLTRPLAVNNLKQKIIKDNKKNKTHVFINIHPSKDHYQRSKDVVERQGNARARPTPSQVLNSQNNKTIDLNSKLEASFKEYERFTKVGAIQFDNFDRAINQGKEARQMVLKTADNAIIADVEHDLVYVKIKENRLKISSKENYKPDDILISERDIEKCHLIWELYKSFNQALQIQNNIGNNITFPKNLSFSDFVKIYTDRKNNLTYPPKINEKVEKITDKVSKAITILTTNYHLKLNQDGTETTTEIIKKTQNKKVIEYRQIETVRNIVTGEIINKQTNDLLQKPADIPSIQSSSMTPMLRAQEKEHIPRSSASTVVSQSSSSVKNLQEYLSSLQEKGSLKKYGIEQFNPKKFDSFLQKPAIQLEIDVHSKEKNKTHKAYAHDATTGEGLTYSIDKAIPSQEQAAVIQNICRLAVDAAMHEVQAQIKGGQNASVKEFDISNTAFPKVQEYLEKAIQDIEKDPQFKGIPTPVIKKNGELVYPSPTVPILNITQPGSR